MSSSPPPDALGAGWWHCVALGPRGAPVWLAVAESGRHPDRARLELPLDEAEREIGNEAACIADYDDLGHVRALRVGPRGATKAPPIWYVEVRESSGRPPAVNLVAFTGHGVAAGALLDEPGIGNTPATSADQVGAARWYPATGELDQIYVQPDWRRRNVATALLWAAGTLARARGWPRLWTDGQRTELGERLRQGSPWPTLAADLTHTAPPMTPGES